MNEIIIFKSNGVIIKSCAVFCKFANINFLYKNLSSTNEKADD